MLKTAFTALTLASALAITSNAYAADLIIDEPAMAGVVEVSGSWDGPFIGVFGGYGWGDYSEPEDDLAALGVDGWLVGAAVGTNFHLSEGIIVGVVGDVAWSDMSGGPIDANPEYTVDIDWAASLRGRVAIDGGALMPYLTAGLAVAGVSVDDGPGQTDGSTNAGWTVGAGVEFAATDDLSIDLLYRYSDYVTQTYDVGGGEYEASITAHQLTVGLNWSF
jgi:outer membrane immunogenic protein